MKNWKERTILFMFIMVLLIGLNFCWKYIQTQKTRDWWIDETIKREQNYRALGAKPLLIPDYCQVSTLRLNKDRSVLLPIYWKDEKELAKAGLEINNPKDWSKPAEYYFDILRLDSRRTELYK